MPHNIIASVAAGPTIKHQGGRCRDQPRSPRRARCRPAGPADLTRPGDAVWPRDLVRSTEVGCGAFRSLTVTYQKMAGLAAMLLMSERSQISGNLASLGNVPGPFAVSRDNSACTSGASK